LQQMSDSNEGIESPRPANQSPLKPLLRAYSLHLAELGLSENTQIGYKHQVSLFLAWLGEPNVGDFALTVASAQYVTVLEYTAFLKIEKSVKQNTIKTALTAVDSFCEFLQLGKLALERDASLRRLEQRGFDYESSLGQTIDGND
jgi:site-specific recombinase XerD